MGGTLKRRLTAVPPLVWLLLLTLALLVPFGGKAYFTDDTLFLRAAQQIQKHPLDFYGFNINWYGDTTPMTAAMDNPPLDSYYIALVATFLGWSEWALHLAFLLPALAAVWGIYALAKNYCEHPFTAALIALLSPVFLISATAVMCDVMQLAFWIWTLVFFEKGLRTENRTALLTSGILAGFAFLTKYLALSLIPLLLAYGFCCKRRPGWWLVAPLIPLLFVGGYEYLTFRLYGQGLLSFAAGDSMELRTEAHKALWESFYVGMSFVGACFLPVLLYAPLLWSRRMLLAMPCLMATGLLIFPRMTAYLPLIWKTDGGLKWLMFFYIAMLVVAGLYVFLLAGMDLRKSRGPVSVLLLLWLSGIFVFTVALNWTIDGRSLLPALPAVGILAARQMERNHPNLKRRSSLQFLAPAFLAGAISFMLVLSDCNAADGLRSAAIQLGSKYQFPGKTTWFDNHWGFQYYIEPFGAKALECKSPKYSPGDILIIINTPDFREQDFHANGSNRLRLIETGKFAGRQILSTDPDVRAGFYCAGFGALPFVVGNIPQQFFRVYQIVKATGYSQTENTSTSPAARPDTGAQLERVPTPKPAHRAPTRLVKK